MPEELCKYAERPRSSDAESDIVDQFMHFEADLIEGTLLARKHSFTALFAYNDIAAIGAIWAFHEAGLRVPEDISVVGFDDIPGAAYANPGLTTVRQPLVKMGQIAAQTVVDLIEGRGEYVPEIAIEPEFVIRQSTGSAPAHQLRNVAAGTKHSEQGYLAK